MPYCAPCVRLRSNFSISSRRQAGSLWIARLRLVREPHVLKASGACGQLSELARRPNNFLVSYPVTFSHDSLFVLVLNTDTPWNGWHRMSGTLSLIKKKPPFFATSFRIKCRYKDEWKIATLEVSSFWSVHRLLKKLGIFSRVRPFKSIKQYSIKCSTHYCRRKLITVIVLTLNGVRCVYNILIRYIHFFR